MPYHHEDEVEGSAMEVSLGSLVLIPLIALAAPLLTRSLARWIAIPIVVFEIVLGILLGPQVLGWVESDDFITLVADFGLAFLFFLAGNEIDFTLLRGRPIRRAALGWMISLVLAIGASIIIASTLDAGAFIAVALTSTALGTLMPMLRDVGELQRPFGVSVLAVGAVGEFGPLLAISLFLSGRNPGVEALVLVGFVLVAGAGIWLAARGAGRGLYGAIGATLHTSSQIAVRLVIAVLLALVVLSIVLGLDMLLGAFTAGVLFRLLIAGAPASDRRVIEHKLEAIGFGFLVPIFFIDVGMTFDVAALVSDVGTLLLLPLFVVLLFIVRGLPSMLAAPSGSSLRDRIALGLLGATGLPIIVAVTALGVATHALEAGVASAMVGAGMLSVLLFPIIAFTMRRSGTLDSRPPRRDSNSRPSG